MGRAEQVIISLAILQTEEVRSVLFPTVGLLVWLFWKHRWEVNFLEARAIHLLTNNAFDIAEGDIAEW